MKSFLNKKALFYFSLAFIMVPKDGLQVPPMHVQLNVSSFAQSDIEYSSCRHQFKCPYFLSEIGASRSICGPHLF